MRVVILLITLVFYLFANIGIISSLKGKAVIKRGPKTIKVKLGTKIDKKDIIITKTYSKAQILFNDKTIITVGKNTSFQIAEYSNSIKNPKASFKVNHGFFKVMTGKIGKLAPHKFKLLTTNATVGIRGTHFLGLIENEKDSIACTNGSISVVSNFDGSSVDVFEGQITFIMQNASPTTPRDFSTKELKKLSSTKNTKQESKNKETKTQESEEIKEQDDESTNEIEVEDTVSNVVASNAGIVTYKGMLVGSVSDTIEKKPISIDYGNGENIISNGSNIALNSIEGEFDFASFHIDIGESIILEHTQDGIKYKIKSYSIESDGELVASIASLSSNNYEGFMSVEYSNDTDYVEWGSWIMIEDAKWIYDKSGYLSLDTSTSSNSLSGQFVIGEQSSSSVIDGYKNSHKVINYSGTLATSINSSTNINLNVDFGSSAPLSGNVAGYNIEDGGAINGNGFSTSNIVGVDALLEGNFYGPLAQEIGGVFSVDNNSYSIFTAKEQGPN